MYGEATPPAAPAARVPTVRRQAGSGQRRKRDKEGSGAGEEHTIGGEGAGKVEGQKEGGQAGREGGGRRDPSRVLNAFTAEKKI